MLGVARLHALITTGRVLSKSAAGEHAMAGFPAHEPIVRDALRLRHGEPVAHGSRLRRRRAVIAFMDAVIGLER